MTGAFIFDLDGVVADTTPAHFRSWQRLAAEADLPFDRTCFARMLGRTRADSLDILLDGLHIDRATRLEWLVRKQAYFTVELADMTPADALPGVVPLIDAARACGIGIGLASSSRNARAVLKQLALTSRFDAVADGASPLPPKPAPDIFLWVAEALGHEPRDCVVFEDARAGVDAALQGGFSVVAVGLEDARADWSRASLAGAIPEDFMIPFGSKGTLVPVVASHGKGMRLSATTKSALAWSVQQLTDHPSISAMRILVVEDDYVVATDLCGILTAAGATVVGPSGTVDAALQSWGAAKVDAAVLDINLHGRMTYDLADQLRAEGVPLVFATGYDRFVIPKDYRDVPVHSKPVDAAGLVASLSAFGRRPIA